MYCFVSEVAEGEAELAQQRIEDMVCLNVASLAALTHLPVQAISGVDGKKQVGGCTNGRTHWEMWL